MIFVRLLATLTCVAFSGGAALAQFMPVLPGRGLPIPPSGVPDGIVGATTRGITVSGRGTVNAPPDRLTVTIFFNTQFSPPGMPRPVGFLPLDDVTRSVVNAMHRAGVDDARIVLPLFPSGGNAAPQVVGSLTKPTRELVESIVRKVTSDLPATFSPALPNYQIQSRLVVNDCSPFERRAQTAAFADARARAELAAAAAGVHVGRAIAIDQRQFFGSAGCATKPDDMAPQQQFFYDPYGPFVVPVTSGVTVTYELLP